MCIIRIHIYMYEVYTLTYFRGMPVMCLFDHWHVHGRTLTHAHTYTHLYLMNQVYSNIFIIITQVHNERNALESVSKNSFFVVVLHLSYILFGRCLIFMIHFIYLNLFRSTTRSTFSKACSRTPSLWSLSWARSWCSFS
jgi:hypothetical protein